MPWPFSRTIVMGFSFESAIVGKHLYCGKIGRNEFTVMHKFSIDCIHVLLEVVFAFNSKYCKLRKYASEHMSRKEGVCRLQIIQEQSSSGWRQALSLQGWMKLEDTQHNCLYPSTNHRWLLCNVLDAATWCLLSVVGWGRCPAEER